MKTYVPKNEAVQARQVTNELFAEDQTLNGCIYNAVDRVVVIKESHSWTQKPLTARMGEWIVCNSCGIYFVWDDENFQAKFQPVEQLVPKVPTIKIV